MNIKCIVFGHKKYKIKSLGFDDLFTIRDALGVRLFAINVCERCGNVFTDLRREVKDK